MNNDLDNLNENGSVPNTRVTDPIVARQISNDIIDQNDRRLDRNSRVKGLVDGRQVRSTGQTLTQARQCRSCKLR